MISFQKWLSKQAHRTDAVGEYAKKHFKTAGRGRITRKTTMTELAVKAASKVEFEHAHSAWNEYERIIADANGAAPTATPAS